MAMHMRMPMHLDVCTKHGCVPQGSADETENFSYLQQNGKQSTLWTGTLCHAIYI